MVVKVSSKGKPAFANHAALRTWCQKLLNAVNCGARRNHRQTTRRSLSGVGRPRRGRPGRGLRF